MAENILLITPMLTGGTNRFIYDLCSEWQKERTVIVYEYRDRAVNIKIYRNGEMFQKRLMIDYRKNIINEICEEMDIKIIHINHFIHMDDLMLNQLCNLDKAIMITLHDYYLICPRVNLYRNGKFCGLPDKIKCGKCYPMIDDYNAKCKEYRKLLLKAKLIACPSFDMVKRMEKIYDDVNFVMRENPEVTGKTKHISQHNTSVRAIGIIGMIDQKKGRDIIIQTAKRCLQLGLLFKFILFGDFLPNIADDLPNVVLDGKYREDEVYERIRQYNIDIFWFPAQWPETYSYTLTIPIRLGIPILASDLGAIGERVCKHGWGKVYPYQWSEDKIIEVLHTLNPSQLYEENKFMICNDKIVNFYDYYGIESNERKTRDMYRMWTFDAWLNGFELKKYNKVKLFELIWIFKNNKLRTLFLALLHMDFRDIVSKVHQYRLKDICAGYRVWMTVFGDYRKEKQ